MQHNVDVLNQQSSLAWIDSQSRQHAIAANGNDFVTKFGNVAFDVIKELQVN